MYLITYLLPYVPTQNPVSNYGLHYNAPSSHRHNEIELSFNEVILTMDREICIRELHKIKRAWMKHMSKRLHTNSHQTIIPANRPM